MLRVLTIRNVPDRVHRALKARAAMTGMSVSDFLLVEIRRLAERPTIAELRERLRRPRVSLGWFPQRKPCAGSEIRGDVIYVALAADEGSLTLSI